MNPQQGLGHPFMLLGVGYDISEEPVEYSEDMEPELGLEDHPLLCPFREILRVSLHQVCPGSKNAGHD